MLLNLSRSVSRYVRFSNLLHKVLRNLFSCQVSLLIRKQLTDRARDFNMILDDVAITELSFGKEYAAAVESKQVAQQEAQRAAFVVDKAKQERQQKIVQAEGEAAAAAMLGEAISKNPGYLKLRKLRASQNISKTVCEKNASKALYFIHEKIVKWDRIIFHIFQPVENPAK